MTAFNSQTISLGTPFCPRQEQPPEFTQPNKNTIHPGDPLMRYSNLPDADDSDNFPTHPPIIPSLDAFPLFATHGRGSLGMIKPHFPLTPSSHNCIPFTTIQHKKLSLDPFHTKPFDHKKPNCFKNEILTQIEFENGKLKESSKSQTPNLLGQSKSYESSQNVLKVLNIIQKSENMIFEKSAKLNLRKRQTNDAQIVSSSQNKVSDPQTRISPPNLTPPFSAKNLKKKSTKTTTNHSKTSIQNESEVINKKIKKIFRTASNKIQKNNNQKSQPNTLSIQVKTNKTSQNDTFSQIMTESRVVDRSDEKKLQLLSFATKSSFINTEQKKESHLKSRTPPLKVIRFGTQETATKTENDEPKKNPKSYFAWRTPKYSKTLNLNGTREQQIPSQQTNKTEAPQLPLRNKDTGRPSDFRIPQDKCLHISDLKMPELVSSPKLNLTADSKPGAQHPGSVPVLETPHQKISHLSKPSTKYHISGIRNPHRHSQTAPDHKNPQQTERSNHESDEHNTHLPLTNQSRFGNCDNLIYRPSNLGSSTAQHPSSSIYSKGVYRGANLSRRMKKKFDMHGDSLKFSLEISNLSRQFGRQNARTHGKHISQDRISSVTDRPTIYNITSNKSNQNLRNFLRPKNNSNKFLTKSINISLHSGISHLDQHTNPLRPTKPRAIQSRSSLDKFTLNLHKISNKNIPKSQSFVEKQSKSQNKSKIGSKLKSRTSMERFPAPQVLDSISHRHSIKLYESKIFNKDNVSIISQRATDKVSDTDRDSGALHHFAVGGSKHWEQISARASFIFKKTGSDHPLKKNNCPGQKISHCSNPKPVTHTEIHRKPNHNCTSASITLNQNIQNSITKSKTCDQHHTNKDSKRLPQKTEKLRNLKLETRHDIMFRNIELSGPEIDNKLETFGQSFVNNPRPKLPHQGTTPVMKEDWNESERARPLWHGNSAWAVLEANTSGRKHGQTHAQDSLTPNHRRSHDVISSHNLKDLETPNFSKDPRENIEPETIQNPSKFSANIKNTSNELSTNQNGAESSISPHKPNIFHSEDIQCSDQDNQHPHNKGDSEHQDPTEEQLHKTEFWLSDVQQQSQKKEHSKEVNVKISVLNILGNEAERPNPAFQDRLFQEIGQAVDIDHSDAVIQETNEAQGETEFNELIDLTQDTLIQDLLSEAPWRSLLRTASSAPSKPYAPNKDGHNYLSPHNQLPNTNLQLTEQETSHSHRSLSNRAHSNPIHSIPKLDIGSLEASEIKKLKLEVNQTPGEHTEKMLQTEQQIYAQARQNEVIAKNTIKWETKTENNEHFGNMIPPQSQSHSQFQSDLHTEGTEVMISQISFERIKQQTQRRTEYRTTFESEPTQLSPEKPLLLPTPNTHTLQPRIPNRDPQHKNENDKNSKISNDPERDLLEMMKENKSHESYLLPKSTSDYYLDTEIFIDIPPSPLPPNHPLSLPSATNLSHQDDLLNSQTQNDQTSPKSLDEINENFGNENSVCQNKGVIPVAEKNKQDISRNCLSRNNNGTGTEKPNLAPGLNTFGFDSGERELLQSEHFEVQSKSPRFGLEDKTGNQKENPHPLGQNPEPQHSSNTKNPHNQKSPDVNSNNTPTQTTQQPSPQRAPLATLNPNTPHSPPQTQPTTPIEEDENEEVVYAIRTNIETIVEYSELLLKIIQEDFFDQVLGRINFLKTRPDLVKHTLKAESQPGGWDFTLLAQMGIDPPNAAQIILDIGSVQAGDKLHELWQNALASGILAPQPDHDPDHQSNQSNHPPPKSTKFSHFKDSKHSEICLLTSQDNIQSHIKISSDDRETLYLKQRKLLTTPSALKISKTEDLNSDKKSDVKIRVKTLNQFSNPNQTNHPQNLENVENLKLENLNHKKQDPLNEFLDIPDPSYRPSSPSPKSNTTISNMDNFATINEDLDSRPISHLKGDTSIACDLSLHDRAQILKTLSPKPLFASTPSHHPNHPPPQNPFHSATPNPQVWLFPSKPYLPLPKDVFLRLTDKILSSYADSNIQPNLFDIQKIFHRSIFDAFNESLSEYLFRLRLSTLIPAEIELLKKSRFDPDDLVFALNKAKFLLTEKASEMVGFLLNKEDSALDHLPHLVQQENIDLLQREKMTKMVLKDFFTEPCLATPTIVSQADVIHEIAVVSDEVFTFLVEDLVSELTAPF